MVMVITRTLYGASIVLNTWGLMSVMWRIAPTYAQGFDRVARLLVDPGRWHWFGRQNMTEAV